MHRVAPSRFAAIGAVCLISGASALNAQPAKYKKAELQKMIREATTPERYQKLVNWFRDQEASFRRKAEERNQAYERYRQWAVPSKHPNATDGARNLRDYYQLKADE